MIFSTPSTPLARLAHFYLFSSLTTTAPSSKYFWTLNYSFSLQLLLLHFVHFVEFHEFHQFYCKWQMEIGKKLLLTLIGKTNRFNNIYRTNGEVISKLLIFFYKKQNSINTFLTSDFYEMVNNAFSSFSFSGFTRTTVELHGTHRTHTFIQFVFRFFSLSIPPLLLLMLLTLLTDRWRRWSKRCSVYVCVSESCICVWCFWHFVLVRLFRTFRILFWLVCLVCLRCWCGWCC